MNTVILMGNIGKDIESRYTQAGLAIAAFSLATTKTVKGEKKTQWHNVKAFGKTAETIAQYFNKGSKILIEGEISYSEWEKDGVKHRGTDIIVNQFHFVDGKKQDGNQASAPPVASRQDTYQAPGQPEPPKSGFDDDSDIPF